MPRHFALALALTTSLAPSFAHAHGADGDVELHVGYAYDNCYIDLHEELTQRDFTVFSRQFADAGAFLPMSGARVLGAGNVALGLSYNQTFIDDSTPQWNHTFSHPGEDHWLGRPALPELQGRVGLGERLDGELMVTGDPSANWGIAGVGVRRAILEEAESVPLSLSARATYVHLLGAPELAHDSGSVELLMSHRFGRLTPYLGGGVTAAVAREQTDELVLDPALAFGGRAALGAELALGRFRVAGQGMLASVPSAALMVGASF